MYSSDDIHHVVGSNHGAATNIPAGVQDNKVDDAAALSPTQPNEKDSIATDSSLHGPRLWIVTILNATMLFLVQTEIFIVTTSLVAIAEELGDFDRASWILASYFLGYVGFVVIVAKFSDIFGRKPVYIFSILVFTIFSGCCAAAKTMEQLIILRAFQGLGGGGSYALATILTIEIVPPENSVTTWRWIFLFNVPIGVVGLAMAIVGIPSGFPHNKESSRPSQSPPPARPLDRLDIPGCVMLLLATMSMAAAFQEAGSRFAWDSAYFITLLVVSVLLWIALMVWERRVTLATTTREPVLPWRFLTSRVMVGALLGIILQGGPLTVTNLQIPQRLQLVNGQSSLNAGVRLIPFGAGLSVGTILSANAVKRAKVSIVYFVIVGALLQVLGYALLSSMGSSVEVPRAIYAYQIIAVAEKRDHAVAMGAANQFRAIGSTIMVAITTAIFNGYVYPRLSALGISDPNRVIQTYSQADIDISPELWDEARQVLSKGYNRQMYALIACGVAQAAAALLLWKKNQAPSPPTDVIDARQGESPTEA
ncbi:hypothetical protein PFICI_11981 [Pestalotiopsis fici W106-1]|uniref:Major facilitator superfamily (MFS) profile domain-containing protein n=1 Tax=Pestalotiopsis fici (strain W106-1 / CGMCC3.15140) TaxID=1229662 RepID=W3WRY9_PESFW|nr:uncharacterized protein PFICI_11981 [Pestalotiopsis fici W106-1]ETS76594.1 hypothetical protein PFICI_11981 [Pestalotiopsis fici W106-1]